MSGHSCLAASQDEQLADYLGPAVGKTFVYSVTGDADSSLTQITVAGGESRNRDELVTCSPAIAAEYPKEIRKLGGQPVISRIVIRDGAIVSTRGGTRTILLKSPLAIKSRTWTNRQSESLSGGVRTETIFSCGISSVDKTLVLGVERETVTVTCSTGTTDQRVITAVTYAKGLGPIEEDTETYTGSKAIGVLKRQLTAIRDDAGECASRVHRIDQPNVER
jgi:hypothetical protein